MASNEKKLLRKQLRAAYGGDDARNAESRVLCRALLDWDVFRGASVVAAYVPLPREADITPVLHAVLEAGHILALPRCGEPPHMTFHAVRSLDELVPGPYGLLEPSAEAPVIAPKDFSLVLVPLEGVDQFGHRLGKGCGYYDALLSQIDCLSVGIALSWQECDRVPTEAHDQPLDAVADAQGIRLIHHRSFFAVDANGERNSHGKQAEEGKEAEDRYQALSERQRR